MISIEVRQFCTYLWFYILFSSFLNVFLLFLCHTIKFRFKLAVMDQTSRNFGSISPISQQHQHQSRVADLNLPCEDLLDGILFFIIMWFQCLFKVCFICLNFIFKSKLECTYYDTNRSSNNLILEFLWIERCTFNTGCLSTMHQGKGIGKRVKAF